MFSVCSLLSEEESERLADGLLLTAPDADRGADVLRPLARRNALAAPRHGRRWRPVATRTSTMPTAAMIQPRRAHQRRPPGRELVGDGDEELPEALDVGMLTRSSGE